MAAADARPTRWGTMLGSTWFKVTAAVVAAGALATGAFVSGGYTTAQTKVGDGSVWAIQNVSGERYARVDTALGQLDTIKSVTSPSDVVQNDGHVLLYAQSNTRVASVDLAQPAAYSTDVSGFKGTPAGTSTVVSTGGYVGYLSAAGEVRATTVASGASSSALKAVADPNNTSRSYGADAIAIGTDGILYAYSHASKTVLRFNITTGRTLGEDHVRTGPAGAGATITVVGDTWALLAPDGQSLWLRGRGSPVKVGLGAKALLQQPSGRQGAVVVASSSKLVAVNLTSGARTTLFTASGGGQAAAPAWNGSKLYAAWLSPATGPGQLWTGHATLSGAPVGSAKRLDYGTDATTGQAYTLGSSIEPVFRGNGGAEILNDAASGWVWSVPQGTIVQGSQDWGLNQSKVEQQNESQVTQTKDSDPTPPVAVNDEFGVRAGSLATLPVMDNDYDANGDVLSIVPGSVEGLSPSFGVTSIANDGQTITVQVAPRATGVATFHYQVTDGTASNGGLKSNVATVTLTVHPPSENSAPIWCNGATQCLFSWPGDSADSPVTVAPGSTVQVPVLRGWVDPDGDAMFASVAQPLAPEPYTVAVSPDGTLVFQAGPTEKPGIVTVMVTISDIYGATTQRALHVTVTPSPTLTVENFGLMTAQNVPLTVDPSSHIRGSKGTPQIVSATLASSSSANISIDSSGATFVFSASQTGSYPVTMTVMDSATKASATATVRITVVASNQPLLSTAPVTVFVRPQTDTSVDVFTAVQNPTGRVLLLSNARPVPAAGASLDVDVVGAAQLRVRGTTASGGAGLLGTVDYLVSDGTNDASMRVEGTATVYLLPTGLPAKPVAMNDSVTVRAGAEVDIPVLQNDVGPEGDLVELDPSSILNPSGQGLAFASGEVLRYLAPQTAPAQPITLYYSAYSAGNPTQEARASVTVTILKQGSDRPPRPVTLTARVTAGSSVTIPFDSYGIDPDGDDVTLDRIMTQPKQGTAQISADGSSIIFTALAGSEGQQTFTYRVRDSEGETGIATVMVGVLNQQTDPAPVAYSDYVQVQAGVHNQVLVQPTANDIDPNGGTLSLGAVTPDAPAGSALYKVLAASIASHNDTQAIIRATPNARTLTYTYSVSNENGDVSEGLIVVDVVRGAVPDYPVATDTIVDAQNRGQLASGIDVVDGKVSWGAGDVSGLKLSLPPQAPGGVSVSGNSIKVSKVPASGLIVPFEVKGPDFNGKIEQTYGFLRVPSLANLIVALKSGVPPMQVREGSSATADLNTYISVPAGDVLIAQNGSAPTTGARKDSSCSVTGSRLTYQAGDGAPWTDDCLVSVRFGDQPEYTVVPVPVQIIPKQPQPQLRPAAITASPGQPAVAFDLTQLVTWLGRQSNVGALRFDVSYTGKLFTVTQNGDMLSVTAKDASQPGLEEPVQVELPGYPSAGSATITLKVGPAPSLQPAGGSTSLVCSEANGTSCSTKVVGLPDEVNAFPRTPLQLVDVAPSAPGCTDVTFRRSSASTVTASWSANAPGGTCTTTFDVRDAQGRENAAGAGSGKLSFQLKGYPSAPASVAEVAYTGSSVTLAVTPGESSSSYPAISGFQVYLDGKKSVTCAPDGSCPPITGLANGAKHTFEAFAVNAVGQSKAGVTTTGWAFAQPVLAGVTATPVYDAGITGATTGAFALTVQNSDASTSSYLVSWDGRTQTLPVQSGGTTKTDLGATSNTPITVTVTPVSAFSPPPGDQVGAQPVSTAPFVTAGSPTINASGTGSSYLTASDSSITYTGTVTGNANGSGDVPSQPYLYAAVPQGDDPGCYNAGSSSMTTNGAITSTTSTISGLSQFSTYDIWACYTNANGAAETKLGTQTAWSQPGAPTGWTFTVSDTSGGSALPDYEFQGTQPTGGSAPTDYSVQFADPTQGYTQNYTYPDTWGQDPQITDRYCANGFLSLCSASGNVTPSSSSAPYQLQVSSATLACTNDATTNAVTGTVTLGGRGIGNASVVITRYSYVDAFGRPQDVRNYNSATVTLAAGDTRLRVTGFQITLPSGFATPAAGTAQQVTVDPSCN